MLKPGMEPSAMSEWRLPLLENLLLLLPRSSRVRVGPRDGEHLLRVGSSSTISVTGSVGLSDSEDNSCLSES